MTTRRRMVAAGFLMTAVGGCSGGGAGAARRDAGGVGDRPAVADPRAAICARADGGGPVPYAVVQQIFDDQCVSCHGPGADLVLEDAVAWTNLVDQPAPPAESCGGRLVVPGDPSTSYLFQKLSSPSPCSGLQMPRGELGSEPLPACVVALIASWIQEGAPGPTDQ